MSALSYAYAPTLYIIRLIIPFLNAKRALPYVRRYPRVLDQTLWYLQLILCISFVGSIANTTPSIRQARRQQFSATEARAALICYLANLFYFSAGLLPEPGSSFAPNIEHQVGWLGANIFELALVVDEGWGRNERSHTVQRALGSVRILTLTLMIVLSLCTSFGPKSEIPDAETAPLLGDAAVQRPGDTDAQPAQPAVMPAQKWVVYLVKFKSLSPYLWPSHSRKLQATLALSFILMLFQRGLNVLVPMQTELLVESLGLKRVPHKEIALYILYRGLQGQQGIVGSLRAILWVPVSQMLYRNLTYAAFQHVLGLSLDFHLSKRIGEVLIALNKGSAMNTFLENFAFQLFPMVFDLGVAALYFSMRFDAFYSLILVAIMWCYIYATIYMARWRAKARRNMAMMERGMDAIKADAMLSYETVHHNGATKVEGARFQGQVDLYQSAEATVLISLNALNIVQNAMLTVGALCIVTLSAYEIANGDQTVAQFVSILSYFSQLHAPLQFFGSFYSQVQTNLVESERMLELFDASPTVSDALDAKELPACAGDVAFRNVTFSYGPYTALRNVSFTARAGTSTAIVGESGSGKSTCLKLLFRFYDVDDGTIEIDGHDVRKLQMESFRKHLAVVPQDTILFHMSILENLRYARRDATDADIHEACQVARIHETIQSFPSGYQTVVGERGLRLSGGEKQRIAIARALLKHPQIVILDEATASLDSRTESDIQQALESCFRKRTTITVAHRLSSISNSDQILVLHQGAIIERGTHSELLAHGGRYHKMWLKQTESKTHQ